MFFTNFVYCLASTNEGAKFYVLANPTRVVLTPWVIILYRYNHCLVQLHFASTGHLKKPQSWQLM